MTSAGGVARAWPDTGVPTNTDNATIAKAVLIAAIKRLVITVAFRNKDNDRFYSARGAKPNESTRRARLL